jgi:predicted RNase H-like HicB family nuclease
MSTFSRRMTARRTSPARAKGRTGHPVCTDLRGNGRPGPPADGQDHDSPAQRPDVIDTSEQDEDDAWSAQAILAPGIATVGEGDTREQAVEECNNGLELLIDELRASA